MSSPPADEDYEEECLDLGSTLRPPPPDDYDDDDITSTVLPQPPESFHVAIREGAAQRGNYVEYDAAPWTRQGQEVTLSDFDMDDAVQVGIGAYGKIQMTKYLRTGRTVALKECYKRVFVDRDIVNLVMNERYALARLDSPYVIKLLAAFHTPLSLYFVMEYMPNGDLSQLIRKHAPFPGPLARQYAAELTAGLHYLRESNVIHRDMKPQNILLDKEFHIRIADFGCCTTLEARRNLERTGSHDKLLPTPTNIKTGSPMYMPPEIYNKEELSFGSDLWSLGCIIFEMYTGRKCFDNPTDIFEVVATPEERQTILKAIGANILACSHTPWPQCPHPLVNDVVSRLLVREPDHRLGMHPQWRVIALQAHGLFEDINWPLLHLMPLPPPIPQRFTGPSDEKYEAAAEDPHMVAVRECKQELRHECLEPEWYL